MKNVVIRSLSGIIYIALIVGALYLGGWWWYGLSGLFTVIGLLEYQRMTAIRDHGDAPIFIRALDMAAALLVWGAAPLLDYFPGCGTAILLMLLIYVLLRLTFSLTQTSGDPFGATAESVLGVIYVAVPMCVMNLAMLRYGTLASSAILSMFVLIWLNDTGAFCVGSLMGKHRLCERLSPKKSWEGFWGGLGFSVIAAAVIGHYAFGMPVAVSAGFGLMVSLFATWGDLFESMLKRSAGVKDAGNIIPGHGGVLDRIDSLLFVAPACAIYLLFTVPV